MLQSRRDKLTQSILQRLKQKQPPSAMALIAPMGEFDEEALPAEEMNPSGTELRAPSDIASSLQEALNPGRRGRKKKPLPQSQAESEY